MVVAVWLLGIFFFIVPAFSDLGDAKDELNDRQVVLSQKNDEVEKEKDLPKKIDEAYAQSQELAKNFYDYTTTQNATDTVDKLLDDKNIVNSTMQIAEYSIKTLKPFRYVSKLKFTEFDEKATQYEEIDPKKSESSSAADSSSADSSSAASSSIPDQLQNNDGSVFSIDAENGVPIGSYNISFVCRGKFSDIQDFCEKLSKNVPGSMVLSNLSITTVNEDIDVAEAEENKGENGESGTTQTQTTTEKKTSDKDKKGVEVYDDNKVEANITIDLMLITKLSKPE